MFREVLLWLERLEIPARDRADVAGEVWLNAWFARRSFDPRRTEPTRWLQRVAVHTGWHYHQDVLRRQEIPLDDPDKVPDPTPDAPSLLIAEETRRGVREAIERLAPHERDLLVGHDIDDIPLRELAVRLEIPVFTAHLRRARALSALRAEMARRDAE